MVDSETKTFVRTLDFASPDGVEVRVVVRSPDGRRMRIAAIESAMANHCGLYPIAVDGKPTRVGGGRLSYPACLAIGIGITLLAYACMAFVLTREGAPPIPRDTLVFVVGYMFPFFVALTTALLAFTEWRSRVYGRTAAALGERHGVRTASAA